jgi:hypothetical protein
MVYVIHGVVSDRMSVFGLESSVDASCFFLPLCGTIILWKMKLSFMKQEKSVSSILQGKLLIANGKMT